MVHPESIVKELRSRFGEFELDHRPPLDAEGGIDTERVRRAAEQKVDISLWLAEKFDPELLIVVFMAADHCGTTAGGNGQSGEPRAGSPRCTGSSTRHPGVSSTGLGHRATYSSSPTTAVEASTE